MHRSFTPPVYSSPSSSSDDSVAALASFPVPSADATSPLSNNSGSGVASLSSAASRAMHDRHIAAGGIVFRPMSDPRSVVMSSMELHPNSGLGSGAGDPTSGVISQLELHPHQSDDPTSGQSTPAFSSSPLLARHAATAADPMSTLDLENEDPTHRIHHHRSRSSSRSSSSLTLFRKPTLEMKVSPAVINLPAAALTSPYGEAAAWRPVPPAASSSLSSSAPTHQPLSFVSMLTSPPASAAATHHSLPPLPSPLQLHPLSGSRGHSRSPGKNPSPGGPNSGGGGGGGSGRHSRQHTTGGLHAPQMPRKSSSGSPNRQQQHQRSRSNFLRPHHSASPHSHSQHQFHHQYQQQPHQHSPGGEETKSSYTYEYPTVSAATAATTALRHHERTISGGAQTPILHERSKSGVFPINLNAPNLATSSSSHATKHQQHHHHRLASHHTRMHSTSPCSPVGRVDTSGTHSLDATPSTGGTGGGGGGSGGSTGGSTGTGAGPVLGELPGQIHVLTSHSREESRDIRSIEMAQLASVGVERRDEEKKQLVETIVVTTTTTTTSTTPTGRGVIGSGSGRRGPSYGMVEQKMMMSSQRDPPAYDQHAHHHSSHPPPHSSHSHHDLNSSHGERSIDLEHSLRLVSPEPRSMNPTFLQLHSQQKKRYPMELEDGDARRKSNIDLKSGSKTFFPSSKSKCHSFQFYWLHIILLLFSNFLIFLSVYLLYTSLSHTASNLSFTRSTIETQYISDEFHASLDQLRIVGKTIAGYEILKAAVEADTQSGSVGDVDGGQGGGHPSNSSAVDLPPVLSQSPTYESYDSLAREMQGQAETFNLDYHLVCDKTGNVIVSAASPLTSNSTATSSITVSTLLGSHAAELIEKYQQTDFLAYPSGLAAVVSMNWTEFTTAAGRNLTNQFRSSGLNLIPNEDVLFRLSLTPVFHIPSDPSMPIPPSSLVISAQILSGTGLQQILQSETSLDEDVIESTVMYFYSSGKWIPAAITPDGLDIRVDSSSSPNSGSASVHFGSNTHPSTGDTLTMTSLPLSLYSPRCCGELYEDRTTLTVSTIPVLVIHGSETVKVERSYLVLIICLAIAYAVASCLLVLGAWRVYFGVVRQISLQKSAVSTTTEDTKATPALLPTSAQKPSPSQASWAQQRKSIQEVIPSSPVTPLVVSPQSPPSRRSLNSRALVTFFLTILPFALLLTLLFLSSSECTTLLRDYARVFSASSSTVAIANMNSQRLRAQVGVLSSEEVDGGIGGKVSEFVSGSNNGSSSTSIPPQNNNNTSTFTSLRSSLNTLLIQPYHYELGFLLNNKSQIIMSVHDLSSVNAVSIVLDPGKVVTEMILTKPSASQSQSVTFTSLLTRAQYTSLQPATFLADTVWPGMNVSSQVEAEKRGEILVQWHVGPIFDSSSTSSPTIIGAYLFGTTQVNDLISHQRLIDNMLLMQGDVDQDIFPVDDPTKLIGFSSVYSKASTVTGSSANTDSAYELQSSLSRTPSMRIITGMDVAVGEKERLFQSVNTAVASSTSSSITTSNDIVISKQQLTNGDELLVSVTPLQMGRIYSTANGTTSSRVLTPDATSSFSSASSSSQVYQITGLTVPATPHDFTTLWQGILIAYVCLLFLRLLLLVVNHLLMIRSLSPSASTSSSSSTVGSTVDLHHPSVVKTGWFFPQQRQQQQQKKIGGGVGQDPSALAHGDDAEYLLTKYPLQQHPNQQHHVVTNDQFKRDVDEGEDEPAVVTTTTTVQTHVTKHLLPPLPAATTARAMNSLQQQQQQSSQQLAPPPARIWLVLPYDSAATPPPPRLSKPAPSPRDHRRAHSVTQYLSGSARPFRRARRRSFDLTQARNNMRRMRSSQRQRTLSSSGNNHVVDNETPPSHQYATGLSSSYMPFVSNTLGDIGTAPGTPPSSYHNVLSVEPSRMQTSNSSMIGESMLQRSQQRGPLQMPPDSPIPSGNH